MKTNAGLIEVRYKDSSGFDNIGIITDLQGNSYINGFRMSFRVYSLTHENGGFETTVIVANAPIACAKMFVTHVMGQIKEVAKIVGGKVISITHNNNVPVKLRFNKMKF